MLQDRLRADLTAAMRARDELRLATLRMVLTAMQTEQVAGKTSRELSDSDIEAVLAREGKKRREAATAYEQAGRPGLAARERAEGEVIAEYLPAQLGDEQLEEIVAEALTEANLAAAGRSSLGPAMKAANAKVAGRADGRRVAAAVGRQLG